MDLTASLGWGSLLALVNPKMQQDSKPSLWELCSVNEFWAIFCWKKKKRIWLMMSKIQRANGKEIIMALDKKRAHLQKTYIWSFEFSTRTYWKMVIHQLNSPFIPVLRKFMIMCFSVNPIIIIIIIILSSLSCWAIVVSLNLEIDILQFWNISLLCRW